MFFGALAFFGVPLLVYVVNKLNYARVEYRFYRDRIELDEGFFAVNRKEVRYADVREITLRKGFDVRDPDPVYKKMRRLVKPETR